MLIHQVNHKGELVDVRLFDGRIVEIGAALSAASGEDMIYGQGGALLPGLHDHHIHLNATAAAMGSVRCGPPEVLNAEALIAALQDAIGDGWVRGVGYHASVAGEIDRAWLDEHGPQRPTRIQHRSGRLWIFNSLAIAELGGDLPEDGRLFDGDPIIRSSLSGQYPDLSPLVQQLIGYGITGVTEVTPGNSIKDFEHLTKTMHPLQLSVMGKMDLSDLADPRVGAVKLHYHDNNLPELAALVAEVASAHAVGRPVAAHCVTRAELMLTLSALEAAGVHPGDRIEHAAISDDMTINWMSELGVIVVTQPLFIQEREAAYLAEVEVKDHPNLWRLKSFFDAGLPVAAGSDAPFGRLNPWRAMAAATARPGDFAQEEQVSPEEALSLYLKPAQDAGGAAREVAIGSVADLCLLDRPWTDARDNLAEVTVAVTFITGEPVYERIASINPQSSAI